jgi:hypothetical protein
MICKAGLFSQSKGNIPLQFSHHFIIPGLSAHFDEGGAAIRKNIELN